MLKSSSLYLASVTKFSDQTEGIMTVPSVKMLRGSGNSYDTERYLMLHKATRPFLFAQCWCAHNSELRSMWERYCAYERPNEISKNGIAIRSTFASLRGSLDWNDERLIRISLVSYLDRHQDLSNVDNMLSAFLEKDISMIDERELRILFNDVDAFQKNSFIPSYHDPLFRRVCVDVRQLVNGIIPSPTAGDHETEKLRDLLIEFSMEDRLVDSRLLERLVY